MKCVKKGERPLFDSSVWQVGANVKLLRVLFTILYIHDIFFVYIFFIDIDNVMEEKMCQNSDRATTSIQSLPEELKTKIFLELPMKDIFSVCLVCKQWNYIVMSNESVWKLRCYNLPEFLHKNIVNDKAQGHSWKVNILIHNEN